MYVPSQKPEVLFLEEGNDRSWGITNSLLQLVRAEYHRKLGWGMFDSVWGRAGGLPRREDTLVLSLRMSRSLAVLTDGPPGGRQAVHQPQQTPLLYVNILEWEGESGKDFPYTMQLVVQQLLVFRVLKWLLGSVGETTFPGLSEASTHW